MPQLVRDDVDIQQGLAQTCRLARLVVLKTCKREIKGIRQEPYTRLAPQVRIVVVYLACLVIVHGERRRRRELWSGFLRFSERRCLSSGKVQVSRQWKISTENFLAGDRKRSLMEGLKGIQEIGRASCRERVF